MGRTGIVVLVALCASVGGAAPSRAQDQTAPANLLVNGSVESPYYAEGAPSRTVPHGWHLWIGAGTPSAVPHKDKPQVRDGTVAWNVEQSGGAFTAAGYQQVSGVTSGVELRLSAYGWVFTCDDPVGTCIIAQPPYRRSDATAGAVLKVGIDPAGGTDPTAPGVRWSAAVAPYDQWVELSVSAAAQAETVTVFLYGTQTRGLAINDLYWDEVTLVAASEATPEPNAVPYVLPQGVRADGSIVHIIQAGDTLSSIAYAYHDYGVTIESIAALNAGIRPTTRYLTPGNELLILPPGSVDPATGELIAGTGAAAAPAATLTPTAASSATFTATPSPTPPAATTAPTSTPTVTPTPSPTQTLTPTAEPSATETPADTPTSAPSVTAPATLPQVFTATSGTLCLSVFQDDNLNGQRDDGEATLTGVIVVLTSAAGQEQIAIESTAQPLCVERPAGSYTVRIVPPGGYGLTTAGTLLVELASGRRHALLVGAAPGYSPPTLESSGLVPTPVAAGSGAVAPLIDASARTPAGHETWLDRLYDASGVIVLIAAGVIALGSALALGLLRRR